MSIYAGRYHLKIQKWKMCTGFIQISSSSLGQLDRRIIIGRGDSNLIHQWIYIIIDHHPIVYEVCLRETTWTWAQRRDLCKTIQATSNHSSKDSHFFKKRADIAIIRSRHRLWGFNRNIAFSHNEMCFLVYTRPYVYFSEIIPETLANYRIRTHFSAIDSEQKTNKLVLFITLHYM